MFSIGGSLLLFELVLGLLIGSRGIGRFFLLAGFLPIETYILPRSPELASGTRAVRVGAGMVDGRVGGGGSRVVARDLSFVIRAASLPTLRRSLEGVMVRLCLPNFSLLRLTKNFR